jgi:cellulose biosynthesis protein BcsQ
MRAAAMSPAPDRGVFDVAEPLILALASHKGGTGRTTAALTLAWCLGQAGHKVTLIDADEQRSATLLALDQRGECRWRNVTFRAGAEALDRPLSGDIVVVDPPALTSPSVPRILLRAQGVILTCLADPLSIRTVPAAATVIEAAKDSNPNLSLLGILICIYNEKDPVQSAMLARLHQAHQDLLLDPVIPFHPEVRNWPLRPGSAPPSGPALEAFTALARNFEAILSNQ